MKCDEFQQWVNQQNAADRLSDVPPGYRLHVEQCSECKNMLREAQKYYMIVQDAGTPEPGDAFWEDYLSTVAAKFRERRKAEESMVFPARIRRLTLSAAAVALLFAGVFLADRYYPFLDSLLNGNEAYSSSIDFIWEEHEQVLSHYMFDPTPLYALEEVIQENWEDEPSGKKN